MKETSHKGHWVEIEGGALSVLFIASGLLIGAFFRALNKNYGVPYTPMLIIAGTVIGFYRSELGEFGDAVEIIFHMNPHGILMIFIPTIIFESAFNTDHFILKNEIYQVLLLAVFGVAIGAGFLAFSFNYILGYSSELPFSAAMCFCSIIGSTDPVAVVSLLKELGTPIKFNLLLEGESLLNDGSAMVFYIIFSSIYKAEGITAMGAVLQFV